MITMAFSTLSKAFNYMVIVSVSPYPMRLRLSSKQGSSLVHMPAAAAGSLAQIWLHPS